MGMYFRTDNALQNLGLLWVQTVRIIHPHGPWEHEYPNLHSQGSDCVPWWARQVRHISWVAPQEGPE